MTRSDTLARVAATIESRKPALGADPATSYVARLLAKGPDAFLKKIGEEATEVVLAAKDVDHGADKAKLVYQVADLWFHSLVALAHYGLHPDDVLAELAAILSIGCQDVVVGVQHDGRQGIVLEVGNQRQDKRMGFRHDSTVRMMDAG